MPGEQTTVGSIVAFLLLNDSDWNRVLDAAEAKAKRLGGQNPTIKIDVDGGVKAIAEMKAVDEGVKRVDDSARKAGGGGGGPGLLLTAILALGPALVPLAAGATAFGVGAAAAAGVAVLAFAGLRQEWKDGTLQGTALGHQITALDRSVDHLKATAAAGVAPGLTAGLRDIHQLMPGVNRDVAGLSVQVGEVAGNTGAALVALFHDFNPLLTDFGATLVSGSGKLKAWASSSEGVKHFVAFAQAELPEVERVIGDTATAVSHLVAAEAPLGGVSLTAFGTLVHLIAALPIGTLQVAAPLITGVVLAVKALKAVNASQLPITIGMSAMVPAALAAGGVLAVLSSITGRHQQAAAQAAQIQNTFTQALVASKGAIDQNVRATVASTLAQQGAFEQGQKVGLSSKTLTDAALGNAAAMKQVSDAVGGSTRAHRFLLLLLKGTAAEFADASTSAKAQTDALKGTTEATTAATAAERAKKDALAASAHEYGASVSTYQAAKQASDQKRDSDQAATLQMQLESDAAGLLKQALDALNGKNLGLAESSTQFNDSLHTLTKSLHDNGETVSDNTDKGIANQRAIEQSIRTAQAHAQAVADATKSTQRGTAAYNTSGQAILDHIAKQNGDKTAADRAKDSTYQFAQQLLGLGKIKVPPTKVDVDKAAAERKIRDYRAHINQVPLNRDLLVTANTSTAEQHLRTLQGLLANLNTNIQSGASVAARKQLPGHNAAGTNDWRGGLTSLAENGPELVWTPGMANLPAGSKVFPNDSPATRAAMHAAGGGMPSTLVVVDSDGALIGRMRVEAAAQASGQLGALTNQLIYQ